ncbi:unnamed protein product [Darwinula stevensoni]|uniref:Transmembrane protein 18 n=1 Tax=Darwinula stevensoni TaxID=69355 RepID=A0A7R9A7J1_9CRUS|nr:unnamed protein product [Darwinula stevensoni]CAG0893620.1 unnamed protein product [Darwinula stevensoni]
MENAEPLPPGRPNFDPGPHQVKKYTCHEPIDTIDRPRPRRAVTCSLSKAHSWTCHVVSEDAPEVFPYRSVNVSSPVKLTCGLLVIQALSCHYLASRLCQEMSNSREDARAWEPLDVDIVLEIFRKIDWTEPWLMALILLHILATITTVATRRNSRIQIFLFLTLLVGVYFSETINMLAAQHWERFSRQQYFDSQGLFISIFFSVPALINCIIIVGNWLYQSSRLMVQVKEMQIRQQRKRAAQNAMKQD